MEEDEEGEMEDRKWKGEKKRKKRGLDGWLCSVQCTHSQKRRKRTPSLPVIIIKNVAG